MLATYPELLLAVREVIRRPDLMTEVPIWVYMLEQELNSVLHRREMTQLATTTTIANQASYALPADFGEAVAMHLTNNQAVTVLQPADYDAIKATYNSQTGQPVAWGFIQNEFALGPTPDGAYPLELLYYKTIPNLSGTQTSNWLLTNYPKIYYYGTLTEAASSLNDDKRSPRWVEAYQSALKILVNDQIRDRGLGGGPLLRADLPFGGYARTSILTDM